VDSDFVQSQVEILENSDLGNEEEQEEQKWWDSELESD
jgi:hypothetical protein